MSALPSSAAIQEIFKNIPHSVIGDTDDIVIERLSYFAQDVEPGDAFFCIVGNSCDGHSFAQEAIDKGAVCLVCQRPLYLADSKNIPIVIVDDTRKAMAVAASNFYGNPSEYMDIIGVTGTNGKTTTTYLIQHILNACGRNCGLVGTTGVKIGNSTVESSRTTPESLNLQRIFGEMVYEHGCDSCVIEVSSHALALDRVWGTKFAATAFTNLTQDHLDYHKTFEEYFEAKAKLFSVDYPAQRIINTGNDWGIRLDEICKENEDFILSYSFFENSDIYPQSVKYEADKTIAQIRIRDTFYRVEYPLVGRFNLENVMCAIGACLSLGCEPKNIVEALKSDISVPGRLEHVSIGNEQEKKEKDLPDVYVDYAHTPDAVSKAAGTVNALKDNMMHSRSIIVFGCGGDRDRTKRPLMGQAALQRSDYAIVTSDNPRTEKPDAIIDDIVAGINDKCYEGRYEVIANRSEAIKRAIDLGRYGDVVLIAGKGHENYQIIGEEKRHFDDREEARNALEEKRQDK